jgi:hypothetical protein
MAIYSPDIRLNKNDRTLVLALGRHLTMALDNHRNLGPFHDKVSVSHEDALELLKLLKSKLGNSDFVRKVYFCEHVFVGKRESEEICKSIYNRGRKKNGKSMSMNSAKWASFLSRLVDKDTGSYHTAHPMGFDHFTKMETKLFKKLDLHPAVIDLMIRLLKEERDFVADVRSRKIKVKPDSLVQPISDIIAKLDQKTAAQKNMIEVSTRKLAAALFLVADSTVLFTTRDWSTTGTLSAISSNAVLLSK